MVKGALKLSGNDIHGYHSIKVEEEQVAFSGWMNHLLKDDQDVAHLLPISDSGFDMYEKLDDGIILCKVVNLAAPETIDKRVINLGDSLSTFQRHENITLAVQSANSIGATVINMDSHTLSSEDNKKWLVIGLLWQLVEMYLFRDITTKNPIYCDGLIVLCLPGETLADIFKLSHEDLLLRWVNYHLEKAGCGRRARNFSSDIKDSEIYTVLLYQIAPAHLSVDKSALEKRLLGERAEVMLEQADKMDCREFVTAQDVKNGHQRLNLAFVANLFNKYPGLVEPEVEVAADPALPVTLETREEKTFRNWINHFGFDPYVTDLYDGLCDGLIILQIMDLIQPGIVDWSRVVEEHQMAKGVQRRYEMLANCNYVISLGKQMGFSLVGISGQDIWEGNKTLTLALTWQLMRAHTLSLLKREKVDVTEQDLINWANEKEKECGKTHTIKNFKDKAAIKTALPIIDTIDCIKPGVVDYTQVVDKPDSTEEENLANAKYAISLGRKIGAPVFALPEDIVEDNPKMVFTIYAALKYTYDITITKTMTLQVQAGGL
jgi:plastin-3